jgi:hypothetical protein
MPTAADPFGGRASQQPVAAHAAFGGAAPQAPAAAMSFEMDEEFAAVRRGGKKKVIVLAAVAALVGGVIGFAVGGLSEKDKVAQLALSSSKELSKEIGEANATAAKLADVMKAAAATLKEGNFPDAQVTELAAINIPFDGSNLTGKAIGRFKPSLVTMLINYTEASAKANAQKEKLQRVLSGNKAGFEKLLEQKDNPVVNWGVYVQQGPQGPWANMQIVPSFTVDDKKKPAPWPAKFDIQEGQKTYSLDRYMGGDLMRGNSAKIIPVAPQTQGAVCPNDTVMRLRLELSALQTVLDGDDTPGSESQGLVELGEMAQKELKKIGG